jgi:hypothetical protein
MTEFAFPSEGFPALPSVSIDAGESWVAIYPPGTVLAVASPREEGRFTPNALVTVSRFGSLYDLDVAIASLDADLAGLPEAHVTVRERGIAAGWPAYVQEVTFRHEAVGTLVQCDLLVLVGDGPVRDLVHVVGTAAGDRLDTDYAEVRAIVQGVSIAV